MTAPNTENQNPEDQQVIPGNNNPEEDPKLPEWHSVLFETNQKLQREREEKERLEREVQDLRSSRNNPPPRVEEAPIDIVNNPGDFVSRLRADMEAQTSNLNSFVEEQKREKLYFRLRNELAQEDPKMGMALQSLYTHVDKYFLDNPGLQVSKPAIRQHIVYLIGEFTLVAAEQQNNNNSNNRNNNPSLSGNRPPNNRQPNNTNNEVIPPHIRPSNRSGNQPNNPDAEPDLDENERKLARDSKLSPREYVLLRDTPDHMAQEVYKKILADRKKGGQ